MRPLKVALVHRDSERCLDHRMYGMWSYAVPEFTTRHFPINKRFSLDRRDMEREGIDLVVHEDAKCWGPFASVFPSQSCVPVVYVVTDSTLSEQHYRERLEQAKQADLVLLDWDKLERFKSCGRPVRRWSYCVNDLLFRDWGEPKSIDVAYHASSKHTPERVSLTEWIVAHARARGYACATGMREGTQYALAFNRAKVVVDLARTPETRNHRAMDVMASRACLLSSPLPEVAGGVERFVEGVHYVAWRDYTELAEKLDWLLGSGQWQRVADAGYEEVLRHHTWRLRAAELRRILAEQFPELEAGRWRG